MSPECRPVPVSGQYQDGEHVFALRIYFEDTDLSGLVYHANYLRYMERARSDMLRLLGIDQRAAQASGEGVYAVSEVAIAYRAPARLDDDLLVRSRLTQLTTVRCVMAQSVWRDATELTRGSVTVAFLDPNGRPRRQPADWIDRFKPYLQKD